MRYMWSFSKLWRQWRVKWEWSFWVNL